MASRTLSARVESEVNATLKAEAVLQAKNAELKIAKAHFVAFNTPLKKLSKRSPIPFEIYSLEMEASAQFKNAKATLDTKIAEVKIAEELVMKTKEAEAKAIARARDDLCFENDLRADHDRWLDEFIEEMIEEMFSPEALPKTKPKAKTSKSWRPRVLKPNLAFAQFKRNHLVE
jgi:hypothetical protein